MVWYFFSHPGTQTETEITGNFEYLSLEVIRELELNDQYGTTSAASALMYQVYKKYWLPLPSCYNRNLINILSINLFFERLIFAKLHIFKIFYGRTFRKIDDSKCISRNSIA